MEVDGLADGWQILLDQLHDKFIGVQSLYSMRTK